MTKKKPPPIEIVFEEGCFDELEDELTQEEMDALVEGIFQLAETGEIISEATPIEELPEEEQAEIIDMLDRKKKKTRH
jgi:hypothetical protein